MEADARWLSYTARATYGAEPLTFEWRARLRVLPGLWVTARDGHADGEGWGGARLMGIKTISERRGPDVLPIQLIRNIAELAFVPDLAAAAGSLRWEAAEGRPSSFQIRASAGDSEVLVRFDVDASGDIVRAWSPARPVDSPEGSDEAPWRCDFADHREFDGVRIPASIVATYEFEDDPWEYLRGEVTAIDRAYDQS